MDSWHITEDEMADIKKEVIERLRPYLCDKLVADRHLDYLRSKRILSRDDAEDIMCRSSNKKKTGRMLDYLAENPKGLDALIESIREIRTKDFVVLKITSEVEVVKSKRKAVFAGARMMVSGPVSAGGDMKRSPSSPPPSYSSCTSTENWEDSLSIASSSLDGGPSPSCTPRGCLFHGMETKSSSSARLPRPGDHGAPQVPDEEIVGTL
uniref:CARD domain-containing protein n=1 Tax=Scleropages formosus TaxID=113540 RepID=A0A8C9V5G3_SCLFO